MNFLVILLIAVSLSMDAFSLSLAYGTNNLNKKDINLLSLVVGIYHFFMPLIGMFIGTILLKSINPNFLVFIILTLVGINMIIETFKKERVSKEMSWSARLLFGLAVSIDSFSVGIGLKAISSNFIMSCLIFSLTSFIFTYIGLIFGKKLNTLLPKISTIIGGIVLIIIGISYLF